MVALTQPALESIAERSDAIIAAVEGLREMVKWWLLARLSMSSSTKNGFAAINVLFCKALVAV